MSTRNTSDNHAVSAAETASNTATGDTRQPILLSNLSDDGALTLTLNRPKQFNALSNEMLDALQSALDKLPDEVRVIVIAGAGKAFCAGHDLQEMRANIDEQWQEDLFSKCSRFMQSLVNLPVPVIARVQGIAAAAGCQLVANCDLAIAADHCTFGVSGVNLGLFCSTPSVALSRNISRKRAFQMLVTGEFIDAETATQWGLMNEAVPESDLDDAIGKLCSNICGKSRVAVSTGKSLFYQQIEIPLDKAYSLAGSTMACNMMAEDVSEGIDAFFGKREPRWKDQ